MRRYSNSSYSSSSYSSSSYSSSTSNISRGVSIYETELRSNAVAPEELFEALVLNGHSLIPMLAPHAVQCGEILEGDGGVGTIKMLTYAPVTRYSYAKYRIEAIDLDNLEVSMSLIEGDDLSDKIERITLENKFLPAPGGGTVLKMIRKYHTRGDYAEQAIADKFNYRQEMDSHIFWAVEKYLLENPNAFN